MSGPETRRARRLRAVRRILVIRRKALGDTLVTLPALLAMVQAFPRARIDLVVDRPFADLLTNMVREVQVLAWPPAAGVSWLPGIFAAHYDLVIDYLGSPRTARWTALSGALLRVGYDVGLRSLAYNIRVARNRCGDLSLRQYAGEAFLDPLRALGIDVAPWRSSDLRPALAAATHVDDQPSSGQTPGRAPGPLSATYVVWRTAWRDTGQPRIALMFSATWPAKGWVAQEACRLHAALVAAGSTPLFVTGPGDEAWKAQILTIAPGAQFAPRTTLLELADLLTNCDLFVGTDCGARHLATGLKVPTVTLFGPTDALSWNPEDPRHVSVRTGEACSPCKLASCPLPDHPCMRRLSADMVLAAIAGQLALADRNDRGLP
jgi:ADP-heptose:LPS heptosyltransferase